MHPTIDRFDATVETAVARVRSPALDAVMYPTSSSADHSLLWFIIGTAVSVRHAAFTAAVLLADRHPGPWYALAAVVASSRVYVGMHHASDVVVGAGVGLALGHALSRWVGSVAR